MQLQSVSIESCEVCDVASRVISIGVIDNKIVYVTENQNIYSIFRYDTDSESTTFLGEFETDLYLDYNVVNYTHENVIFKVGDYGEETQLIKFSLSDKSITMFDFEFYAEHVVAYDKYAYIVKSELNDDENNPYTSTLYRCNLDTFELEIISVIEHSIGIAVTSDTDVYAALDHTDIRKYALDGTYEDVVIKQKWYNKYFR